MAVRDDPVREQIMEAAGTPLCVAIRPGTGTGPPLLLCNGIGMRLEALAVRGCARPGHRGDPLGCPRCRRLSAAQPAVPFHHLGPAPARDAASSRPPAGRRPGYLLGRRAGSAVRAAQPAPVPAADPGGDRNRAADDGAAQPAAAGEEPPPAPLGRPVGRKRENRPGRAGQRHAQGADQPAQHRLPLPAHRRAGVHHAAAAAAHPPAHPGAHRRPGPDHPGGQRPHPGRGHPARDAARLPRRPRRAGNPPEPARPPDHQLPGRAAARCPAR